MGKTCCLAKCKTNYRTEVNSRAEGEQYSVYRFPNKKRFPNDRERWVEVVKKIRGNLEVKDDTVICSRHWPPNPPMIKYYGKERPADPPSVFEGIAPSIVPEQPAPPRTTKRASCHERNQQPDELEEFLRQDRLTFESMKETLVSNSKQFHVPFIHRIYGDSITFLSEEFFEGIPYFMVKIREDLRYETYHMGSKVYIGSLNTIRATKINTWSRFEEVLNFLSQRKIDHKTEVLQQQFEMKRETPVGKKIYSPAVIIRAFGYFCTSRSLYSTLRQDYDLPSIRTLTRLTSRVSKLDEIEFLKNVFQQLPNEQKICSIIFDEVYVKKALLLHGGTVFGKAVNNPECLANTVLGIMLACQYGGPVFLSKMLPVANLDSKFVEEEIKKTRDAIKEAGGEARVLICDDNKVNQSFFNKFAKVPKKPWLTTDGLFLLFDFVHIIKSVRNNWLTEKTKEIIFYDDEGKEKTAKWAHLEALYEAESLSRYKLSHLDEVAVYPKPVERQKVSTCLKIFCDETASALRTHPTTKDLEGVKDTADFISLFVKFFKIVNVKGKMADIRHNDSRESVISDPNDERLTFISKLGDMALKMKKKGKVRERKLTHDTAKALYQTCHGIVDLCKFLLSTSHQYVCIGKFTSDYIEKEFSKLRQGSGGTYFITVQQVIEKLNIRKTSLLLSLQTDMDSIDTSVGHQCSSCNFVLRE